MARRARSRAISGSSRPISERARRRDWRRQMADAALLEVEGLIAGYGAADVLRGIDIDVASGETVAMLGSNGVGKTTLNKVLSGVLRPRAGSIRFDGRSLERATPAKIVEMGLVHVPEGRRIFPDLSVDENLVLGSYR